MKLPQKPIVLSFKQRADAALYSFLPSSGASLLNWSEPFAQNIYMWHMAKFHI